MKKTILFALLLVASLCLQGQGPVKDNLYKQSTVAAKNIMPRPTQEGSVLTNVNGRWGEGQVRAYKVYTALLTQTGTDAPVATILENTLGGTPVWTRTDVGEYRVTLTGAFITNKTVISAGNTAYNDPDLSYSVKLLYYHDNINSILWSCYAVGLVNQDDSLSKCPIEIRVYD